MKKLIWLNGAAQLALNILLEAPQDGRRDAKGLKLFIYVYIKEIYGDNLPVYRFYHLHTSGLIMSLCVQHISPIDPSFVSPPPPPLTGTNPLHQFSP